MSKRDNKNLLDKRKLLRQTDHLTRPPRLEGATKEAMMQPIRKRRKRRPAGS